ncbi:hypothetical protein FAM15407_001496 [Propionibacterium freudenreichii]|uniref:hypothetical protein n=1 Tax=Propionibacterium freudenreichii TaxID=1744 RepID=UPI00254AF437|nr:hypothetical protein [Propionibacterium freudenreichii]MDK9657918.1 hypothetical protein [Propionibacterium freudenreichii]
MGTRVMDERAIPDQWTGVASHTDETITADAGGVLSTVIGWLRPGRPHTVKVTVESFDLDAAEPISVVIQGTARELIAGIGGQASAAVDTTRPVTVALTNAGTVSVRITVTTTDTVPPNPRPADVLALDVWAPVPTQAMRWDLDRWDRTVWQTPAVAAGTLVWDRGRWGQAAWWDTELDATWTPILGPATSVTCRRGIAATGPVLKAQAGTLTVTAGKDLDPRRLGITVGAPIRLYHWPTRTALWLGSVSDVTLTPDKDGTTTVEISAADDVARLVAIKRSGARPDGGGPETWADRLARLMGSAPDITATCPDPGGGLVCPTVWETSLAAHLDALVASSGGWWTGNRWGGITIAARLPTDAPTMTLTDTLPGPGIGKTWAYTAGPSAWQASALISSITGTTHNAAPDDKGEWRADDQAQTVTDHTTATAWTGTSATVDLLATSPADATAALTRLLARATDAPPLASATIRPVSRATKGSAQAGDMTAAAGIDPGQSAITVAAGEQGIAMIAAVAHTITPLTWTTDLTLTSKGQA